MQRRVDDHSHDCPQSLTTSIDMDTTRLIIHLDLDFFYGQVEARLNPMLREMPFAVQQKQIVVTCNYLAREAGVRKLQLITDAKRACPELVLVNGEDIQKYRDASKEIFHHLRLRAGPYVQRLGLDEFWLDVTDLLRDARCASHDVPDGRPFDLNGLQFNFTQDICGHVIGDGNLRLPVHRALCHASCLAKAIRSDLAHELGFTSSAGISTAKILAKLVGAEHKPDDQTTILPEAHLGYIGQMPAFKIPGLGANMLRRLVPALAQVRDRERDSGWPSGSDRESNLSTEQIIGVFEEGSEEEEDEPEVSDNELALGSVRATRQDPAEQHTMTGLRDLLVDDIRQHLSLPSAISLFGEERGRWLYNVAHARDDSRVIASALYPTVISIEDSFQHCELRQVVERRLEELAVDLVRRMEGDLRSADGKWALYPSSVRLTVRHRQLVVSGIAHKHRRVSKTARCPVEVFDSSSEPEQRARLLVRRSLMPLFDQLVERQASWDLSLLNIAVTDLTSVKPAMSIANFLGTKRRRDSESESHDRASIETARLSTSTNGGGADTSISRQSRGPVHLPSSSCRKAQDQSHLSSWQAASSLDSPGAEDCDSAATDASDEEAGAFCPSCRSMIPLFAFETHVCLDTAASPSRGD